MPKLSAGCLSVIVALRIGTLKQSLGNKENDELAPKS